ncbi:hypothetical protein AB0I55_22190 [Actinocatenispora sera]|uniref:hypothetical protein n=1 Tax=Actinocatenispora sera TaxID=390989 RepID=UPI003402DA47
MMETVRLIAVSKDGRRKSIVIEIDDSAQPSLRLIRGDRTPEVYGGNDLFECLKAVRLALENNGFLICCQGSRPTVFPSGMSRQMSNGRLAYPLRRTPPLTSDDLIDIFAPAQFVEVGTVEDQRQAVRNFFRFPKK